MSVKECKWVECEKPAAGKSAFCRTHQKEINKGRLKTPRHGQPRPTLSQYDRDFE